MKKAFFFGFLFIFVCVFLFFSHTSIYTDETEMLQAINKEMKLDEAESHELSIINTILSNDGSKLLLICQLGERYAPRYYAWTYNVVGENKYTLNKSNIISGTDISDISHITWDGKYIVVINNTNAHKYIAIIDGNEEIGTIGGLPETLMLTGTHIEVNFYDCNDNRLLR